MFIGKRPDMDIGAFDTKMGLYGLFIPFNEAVDGLYLGVLECL